MWPQVLEAAKGSPQNDLVMAAVNRALYHTGQLGNAEIVLQQRPSTLFLNEKIYEHAFWFKFDIFLDLGYVNKAEHQLVEGLDYYGERPQLLQRLALVNMVKNNLGTARIYLGALSKMLFYSNWANEYLNEIDLDTTLSMNKQVQSLRQIMMDQDRTSDENIGGYLLDLLNKNRNNQMAFEYLMTLNILRKDLKGVVSNDFNYSPIPRLYEEAILLCSIVPSLKDNLRGKKLTISAESIQLAKDFNKALRVFNGDREATLRGLPDSLRNNYFFYCMNH
jgi:hypothetical protein